MCTVIPGQAEGLSPEPGAEALPRGAEPSDSIDNGIGSGFRALRSAKPRKGGE